MDQRAVEERFEERRVQFKRAGEVFETRAEALKTTPGLVFLAFGLSALKPCRAEVVVDSGVVRIGLQSLFKICYRLIELLFVEVEFAESVSGGGAGMIVCCVL